MLFRIILVLNFLFVASVNSQTVVNPGNISGTWTPAGSPYNVQGSVTVAYGTTLTILPGVTVNFQGYYRFNVAGCLRAEGNATNSILFTSSNTTIGWGGLRLNNIASVQDSSVIQHCKFYWGKASGTGNNSYGGAIFINGVPKLRISDCELLNNTATKGGAIYCSFATPVIIRNLISLNTSEVGGGIYAENAAPFISNNLLASNTASFVGGGIYTTGSNYPTIINNTITLNSVSQGLGSGGGIYSGNGKTIISNNEISKNSSTVNGAGIYVLDGTISNNAIISNSVIGTGILNGGGIGTGSSFSLMINSNFIANNVSENGGGIHFGGSTGTSTVQNNVIVNNLATNSTYGGGAIFLNGASPYIINNTIANNTAYGNGGAIFCGGASPYIINCIIYNNTSNSSGSQIYLYTENSDPNFYHNDVQGAINAFGLNGTTFTGAYQNNIDADPLFVMPSLGVGTNFSGMNANWRIDNNSPCIDIGDTSGLHILTDILGNPRVVGSTIDLGAYENQGPVTIKESDKAITLNFHPNPFNSFTTLKVASIAKSELDIYDNEGKKIQKLQYENTDEIVFEKGNLIPGIYFFNIRFSNGKSATGKFVIFD